MQRDVGVGAFFALVNFAGVERFRVDVNADGALVEFGKIQNLVHGFERVDVRGMRCVHVVNVGREDVTNGCRVHRVLIGDAEILDAQFSDWRGHPAILVAMIVHAAGLSDFPADGHAFKDVVFENQVARVIPFREKAVAVERLGVHGMRDDVVLDFLEREVAFGDGGKAFDPVEDGEPVDRCLLTGLLIGWLIHDASTVRLRGLRTGVFGGARQLRKIIAPIAACYH